MRLILFIFLLFLTSCINDSKSVAKYSILERSSYYIKIKIYPVSGSICLPHNTPSIIRNEFDSREKIKEYGSEGVSFKNGWVENEPVYIVGKDGLIVNSFIKNAKRKYILNIKYIDCVDFMNGDFYKNGHLLMEIGG